jgi:hypothetical protein
VLPSQSRYPGTHVAPQLVPLHVGVAFGGTAHGVHDAPQLETLTLLTHAAPHAWKPALQVKPHAPPVQLGLALARSGHGVQVVEPQPYAGSVADAHAVPHVRVDGGHVQVPEQPVQSATHAPLHVASAPEHVEQSDRQMP